VKDVIFSMKCSGFILNIYICIATQIVENCAFTGSGTKDSANDQSKQPRIAKEILNGVIFAQQIKILYMYEFRPA